MAEVAVNTKTGKIIAEGFTVMADAGKINNKLVVDGQIYGGVAQGIGLALTEDFEDLKKHTSLSMPAVYRIVRIFQTSLTSIMSKLPGNTDRSELPGLRITPNFFTCGSGECHL